VIAGGNPVRLTRKEFDLLHISGQQSQYSYFHMRKLLHTVWGRDYGNEIVYLRVFINPASQDRSSRTPRQGRASS